MKTTHIFLAIAAVCAVSCQHPRTSHYIPRPSDSLYTYDLVAYTYPEDPERALVILDSAYLVGNTSEFDRDYLRATIYGRQQHNPQMGKALEICKQLLQHDSTRSVFASTVANRLNVLDLMTEIYRAHKDYENYLKCAAEIVNLNRVWGNEIEVMRAEAEVALALTQLGRMEEGLQKLDEVRAALSAGAPSISRLDSWIVVTKRKMNTLSELGHYEEIALLAQEIIDRLNDYQAHPEDFAEDSHRLPPIKEARDHWCDFYRAQAHGFLGYSHAMAGKMAEARKELALFEASDYGRTYSGKRMISPAWIPLQEWNKLMAFDDEAASRMGADTLNADYATILHDRSLVAKARGHYAESREWLDRYASLNGKLSDQSLQSQAQYYAALFRQQEQSREIAEVKALSRKKEYVIIGFLILFTLACFVIAHFASTRKRIAEKNKALVRLINELTEQARSGAAYKLTAEDEALFRRIDRTIREERLYADARLQRQDILDRFSLRRQTLNDILNVCAEGKSFPAYINAIRMEEAVRILRGDLSQPFTTIAESVGLNPANFRIQFKQFYGMTPAEYRESL